MRGRGWGCDRYNAIGVQGVLTDYIRAAMRRAKYEILEDGTFYGEIPDFQGVYANAPTLEACREELESALEDWILVCVSSHVQTPTVDGIDLKIKQPA
jgi:predicted RNase H-like HicB family nuclease